LIQHVSWHGGQLAWRKLILLICLSELWRQLCAASRKLLKLVIGEHRKQRSDRMDSKFAAALLDKLAFG
jgi:hypothetical protein